MNIVYRADKLLESTEVSACKFVWPYVLRRDNLLLIEFTVSNSSAYMIQLVFSLLFPSSKSIFFASVACVAFVFASAHQL